MQIIRIAVATVSLALALSATAGADPAVVDAVAIGGPCGARDVNSIASAPNGTTVRCVAVGAIPGFTWETESSGIRQIGRLQSQGFTVNVTRQGDGQLSCVLTSAAAAEAPDAAKTVNVTLSCPA